MDAWDISGACRASFNDLYGALQLQQPHIKAAGAKGPSTVAAPRRTPSQQRTSVDVGGTQKFNSHSGSPTGPRTSQVGPVGEVGKGGGENTGGWSRAWNENFLQTLSRAGTIGKSITSSPNQPLPL